MDKKLVTQIAFKFKIPPKILINFLNPLSDDLQSGVITLLSQEKFKQNSKRYIAAKKIRSHLRNMNRGNFPLTKYEIDFLSKPFNLVQSRRYWNSNQSQINKDQSYVYFDEI